MSEASIYSNVEALIHHLIPGAAKDQFVQLITRARDRMLIGVHTDPFQACPKCLGGSAGQIVHLTPHEIVAAYRWLIESTSGRDREAVVNEAWAYIQTPKRFLEPEAIQHMQVACTMLAQWLRTLPAVTHRGLKSLETREKMRQAHLGKVFTEEHKANLSKAHAGENHWNYGNTTPEHTKAKQSAAMSGENHPLYGKPRPEETRKKIAETLKKRNAKPKRKRSVTRSAKKVKTAPQASPLVYEAVTIDPPNVEELSHGMVAAALGATVSGLCDGCLQPFDTLTPSEDRVLCAGCLEEES